jgi:hypothetical protein
VNELRDRFVRAAECVANVRLGSSCRNTEYRLDVCIVSLMVPILRSSEHRRNLVRSNV